MGSENSTSETVKVDKILGILTKVVSKGSEIVSFTLKLYSLISFKILFEPYDNDAWYKLPVFAPVNTGPNNEAVGAEQLVKKRIEIRAK